MWNESLDFPTVTICNVNLLTKTYAAENFSSLISIFDPSDETKPADSNTTGTHNTDEGANVEDHTITLNELFRKGMLPIEKMFSYCKWINRIIVCGDYIGRTETDYGLCYSFPPNDLREKNSSEFKISQPGPDFGLTLHIDIHQEEYLLAAHSRAAGVKVLVHEPNVMPTPLINGRFFSPGFEHEMTITRKDSVRLSVPYSRSECIDDDTYSFESCLYECQNKIRYGMCDCKPEPTKNERDCTLLDLFTCTNFDMEEYYGGGCHCLPACSTVEYKSQISFGLFPSDLTLRNLKRQGLNKSFEDFQKNNLVLKIYFENMEYVSEIQKPAITWDQLIADIGGQLGLFLGASLITVIEAFGLLFKCVYILCWKKKKTVVVQLK